MRHLLFLAILVFSIGKSSGQDTTWWVASKMDDNHTLWDGQQVNIWAFGLYDSIGPIRSTLPAPLLRANYNDSVHINFFNVSQEDHTIHLHGLDVNQANDGVGSTSFEVNSMDSTIYKFRATHPGSYFYHCHVLTTMHLAMGMYGYIVIDYPGNLLWQNGPGYNKERIFLISDLDKSINDNPISPGPLNEHNPDYFMINGLSKQDLKDTSQVVFANAGDSVLLRIGNMSYNKAVVRFPTGTNHAVLMSDGREIPTPFSSDTLVIHSGERYEIICKPTQYFVDSIQVDYYDQITGNLDETNYIYWNNQPDALPDINKGKLDLYPNPTHNIIHLNSENDDFLSIYSHDGRLIERQAIKKGVNQISLSELNSGIYFFRLEKMQVTAKVIKD
jgi:FtsP/CotA-like multicopper oxidase with cupredoxin domain